MADADAPDKVLAGGGEMGALMRAHDWAATALGPARSWPQPLRTTVRLLLASRHPMFIFWGAARTCLYNDAYRATMGPERHPSALGRPAREVWDEIWDVTGPQLEQIMSGGEATWHEDQRITMTRHGRREDGWWTYGYSPIDDPSAPGGIGGALVVCNDVTPQHLAREALRMAEERARLALAATDSLGVWDWDIPNDIVRADGPFARVYGVDPEAARHGVAIADFTRTIHPDDTAAVGAAIEDAMRTGDEFVAEYRLVQADGGSRWVSARGRCLFGPDGAPLRFPGVSMDITARKLAEDRQNLLLRLSDGTRGLASPHAILGLAAELLGRHLGAIRVGFCSVQPDGRTAVPKASYVAAGAEALSGPYALDSFCSDQAAEHGRGEVVVRDEVTADAVAAHASRAALETRAYVSVPLIRGGELRATLSVDHREPHAWTPDEVELIRDVASRSWDAVERARSEEILISSQARLSAALAIARLGTFEWDMSRDEVTLDARSREIFALAPHEGRRSGEVFARVDPDDFDRVFRAVQAARATSSKLDIEYGLLAPDGTKRAIHSIGAFVNNNDGPPEIVVGIVNDITDRKRIEAELRELNTILDERVVERTRALAASEARASAVFALSPDYLFVVRVDDDGAVWVEDLNPACERVFGKHADEVVGLAPAAFLPVEAAADIVRHALACLSTGAIQFYQVRRRYEADVEVAIDASVAPIGPSPAGGRLVLFSGRDVTDQRRIEEQLRQSQKMEAVGQLTGGLAHDFNNLLTGISGSLEMLEIRVRQGRVGEIDKYVATAQSASKRAAALTHRLLAFSRRQTLDPVPTDVAKLVTGMGDLIRRTVGPAIAVETVNMTGLWTALVDPNQLENALLNLSINARDAMPDGGRLTIETGNKWMDERVARERDVTPGQYLSLCVSDNGTGMPPEVIARAFDPFFTTKPIGLGTGLGLSMIYGFARQSGGQVRIYSEVGEGTMVCIYFPRHYGTAETAEATIAEPAPKRAEEGETVLIVDDEPSVRMLVADVLSDLGYAAVEAEDGPSGLRVLQEKRRIDLLVTDVGLPGGMNGRQVADAARSLRPDLAVLFITGYAENAAVGNGHLDPGMAVLTKPFVVGDLARRIRDLIERPAPQRR